MTTDEDLDELAALPKLEPPAELDARVRNALAAARKVGAAPFWPFEQAIYAVVVVAYAAYVATETIGAFQRLGS